MMNLKTNKLTTMLSLILALALVLTTGIGAYLAAMDSARNQITVGSNEIEVMEDFDPPEKLEPGTSFNKNVWVMNTGSVDCYVRVKAVFSNSHMGDYCTVDWHDKDFLEAGGNGDYNLDNGYWVYNSDDNYWYFTRPIATGETTLSLFTTVKLADDIPASAIRDFDMIVYAESYQAYGASDYEAAWAKYQKNKPA